MTVKVEDVYEKIVSEVEKCRHSFFLNLGYMSWEDVKQIIICHVQKKFHQWDQERALEPWLYRLASNQIKNINRNHYTAFAKPCISCPFAQGKEVEGGNYCALTSSGEQCSECPLYAAWFIKKGQAYNVKLPSSIHDVSDESVPVAPEYLDYDQASKRLSEYMRRHLRPQHFELYEMLYSSKLEESEIYTKLRYPNTESGKTAAYKYVKNWKARFKEMARTALQTEDIL